jgi:hypothetical protein
MQDPNGLIPVAFFLIAIARLIEALGKRPR